ncbi:hypothetical protein HYS47_02260 [Candidatus Woesearchaeota archaeon]|nr:hypothetical protein [Candidatus Woesearchaeota archaeon]
MTTICVFGDSIAWGAFDREAGGWADRLKTALLPKGHQVYNLSICGNTTEDVLRRMPAECIARHPDIVILAIGINDSQLMIQGTLNAPRSGTEAFRNNMRTLLIQGKRYAKRVIIVGITQVDESRVKVLPWAPEKGYSNQRIQEFNTVSEELCKGLSIPFVALFKHIGMGDLDDDGIHLNSTGHQKILRAVKRLIDVM